MSRSGKSAPASRESGTRSCHVAGGRGNDGEHVRALITYGAQAKRDRL
jgi:hypothetical protein